MSATSEGASAIALEFSDVRVFAIGMRTRFRGIDVREGVLLRGPAGWGEFAPFAEYDAAECVPWLRAAREAAAGDWPAPVRDRIPVNVTVPACDPARAAEIVRASGCRTAKVKVAERGQDLAADLDRVAAVRDALGPGGRIRVDANGAWDTDAAVDAIRALDRVARGDASAGGAAAVAGAAGRAGLEYVEQPCATVAELAAVRRRVDVPIAADESIRRAEDPLLVAKAEAADIAVVKVAPLGGVRRALEIVEAIGLPAVVSSAIDTSIGIAAGVALAAALPELPYACGLATVALLESDVVAEPFLPVDGFLTVRRPELDEARIAAAAASPERAQAWRERIAAVERAMTGCGF
jgi:O-succinylbenzoate synthase